MKKFLWVLAAFIIVGVFNVAVASKDNIELSTNRKSPTTSQYVNLTIEMDDDDYTWKLKFSVKYRSSSSSSWSTITRTSSTYFSDYSDEWEDWYYKMKSSDDWEVTLKNLVKFKKKWYYRIYVEDTDGNDNYIQFSVWNSSDDELELSVSDKEPNTNERIKLTIKTDDDYTWKIYFTKLQYRSSSSSSRSNVSMTSSTYVTNYSTYWDNWYYKMTSSDDGEKTISQFIKFKKKWYYRIYAKDLDDNEAYVQIYIGWSSSSSSEDIELSTNRKSPTTSQYVNLTIEMDDDDYTWKLKFSVKYRSSSSSSWSTITRTSSTYFSDYSDEWEDWYYKMKSSDDWEVTLKNLVKFKKKWYYRIYIEDTDGNDNYIQFSVWNSSDDDDDEDEDIDWFDSSDVKKVKSVYKNWKNMVEEMKRAYPHLKKDVYRIKLSDNLYDDMKDIINNKRNRDLEDFDEFEDAFDDRYEYTTRNA